MSVWIGEGQGRLVQRQLSSEPGDGAERYVTQTVQDVKSKGEEAAWC